jgi:hypothetical protein
MISGCPQIVRRTSADSQRRPTLPNGVLAAQTGRKGHHPWSVIRAGRIRLTGQLVRLTILRLRGGSWILALNRRNASAGSSWFLMLSGVRRLTDGPEITREPQLGSSVLHSRPDLRTLRPAVRWVHSRRSPQFPGIASPVWHESGTGRGSGGGAALRPPTMSQGSPAVRHRRPIRRTAAPRCGLAPSAQHSVPRTIPTT